MTERFEDLISIIARLRAEDGCPWDREQTHATLKSYLIEESYEVLQAIDEANDEELKNELGDVLLQVLFHSQIASEEKRFTIDDVVTAICKKLIRRHPHVFGNVKVNSTQEVLQNWEAIKAKEKGEKGTSPKSFLDSVSSKMPALIEARQLTERASYVNFDWQCTEDCIDKLQEEIEELNVELSKENADQKAIAEEMGDLLFVVVNIARKLKIDPDSALKNASRKFRYRFGYIEQALQKLGKTLSESNLEEMEYYWQESKGK